MDWKKISETFLIFALISIAWGIVSTIAVVSFLQKKGKKINFIFINFMIFKYINDYHKIMIEEIGQAGFWYWSFVISMNCALVFAIIGMILSKV